MESADISTIEILITCIGFLLALVFFSLWGLKITLQRIEDRLIDIKMNLAWIIAEKIPDGYKQNWPKSSPSVTQSASQTASWSASDSASASPSPEPLEDDSDPSQ